MFLEHLVANLTNCSTRYETLNGREYLVAPMALITPGVLNGSKGALYYPPEEVSRNVDAWNNTPIVVYHPMENGKGISARDPDVLNSQGIGFVFKAKYNKKLVAEGWFDIEKTKEVDNRILNSLEQGEKIELSTGLFTENEEAEDNANYGGKPYTAIARNYRPDHLAILPDQTGACSIKDGCGVLVNKKKSVFMEEDELGPGDVKFHVTANSDMSHSSLHDLLSTALRGRFTQEEPGAWISEVLTTTLSTGKVMIFTN